MLAWGFVLPSRTVSSGSTNLPAALHLLLESKGKPYREIMTCPILLSHESKQNNGMTDMEGKKEEEERVQREGWRW